MHEEVAAYVLGVLDHEELEAFELHLDSCDRCQEELVDLAGVPARLDELRETPSASEDDPPRSMSR
jgi:anti-sigma factor RsiW